MREVPDQAIRACLSHFQAVDVQYITRKEFTYQIPLSIELNSNPYINDADQNPL